MTQEQSGDKTEDATPKKLKDARERGEVPKSRDLGLMVGLLVATLMLWLLTDDIAARLAALSDASLAAIDQDFDKALASIGAEATKTLLVVSAVILIPVAVFGVVVEFLQVGPIMTAEKFRPQLTHLDPVEGVKRMFGADNWVGLLKSVFYSALLLVIAWAVMLANLDDILQTTLVDPTALAAVLFHCLALIFFFGIAALVLITAADVAYQRHAFANKMKMSQRDIREEVKNTEGNPEVKRERRALAEEWSQTGAKSAASNASVVIVNPVHVAVAILYDETQAPVPVVTGRGEGDMARSMREAARAADVPVLRNPVLARTLLRDTEDGEMVPRELFDIVAEVTLWALRTREILSALHQGQPVEADWQALPTPGEDLTRYPSVADDADRVL